MKRVIFRALLLLGAAIYVRIVALDAMGEWALKHPTLENLKWGLRWDPDNPELWTQYGNSLLSSTMGGEEKAIQAYLKAASLNPLDPENWEGLANAYQQTLEPAKVEKALRSWLEAVPHSPQGQWRLGNFLLLQGRTNEALPYLKSAATGDPQLCLPLYDLAWKALDDPATIAHDLVPDNNPAREEYLQFLIARQKFDAARDAWKAVRSERNEHSFKLGLGYLDGLISAARGGDAANLWQELLTDSGRAAAKPPSEFLTNGDFEAGLPNEGLDWRFSPGAGYKVALDKLVAHEGSHSLSVVFDGSSNPDFSLYEIVPVEPGREYRFGAYMKTSEVTTDNGVRFVVSGKGTAPGEQVEALSDNVVGTTDWKLYQISFHTGPTTQLISVSLRRFRSTKFNNMIQGKVWVDKASLKTAS